jgi:hypothetical protein
LVVQSDHNKTRLLNTIVAIITATTHRATKDPTLLLIDIASPEGSQSGLIHTSAGKREHQRRSHGPGAGFQSSAINHETHNCAGWPPEEKPL